MSSRLDFPDAFGADDELAFPEEDIRVLKIPPVFHNKPFDNHLFSLLSKLAVN